eukprot:389864_1
MEQIQSKQSSVTKAAGTCDTLQNSQKIISKLKQKADDRSSLIVFGYTRTYQQLFALFIPDPIIWICISYYYALNNFDKHGAGLFVEGDYNETCVVKKTRGDKYYYWNACVYGSEWIHSMYNTLIKYKIKINAVQRGDSEIGIGIVSNDDKLIGSFVNTKHIYYSYFNHGHKLCRDAPEATAISDRYGTIFTKNDTITLILDFKSKVPSLCFEVNDVSQGFVTTNIMQNENIKYKLIVTMWNNGDSVTIVNYEET